MKLYVDEPGSDDVRRLSDLVVSQLARVEVPAALWRKHRVGQQPAEAVRLLIRDFEADYFGATRAEPRFAVSALRPAMLDAAARAVEVHGLRGSDGVQLASALAVRSAAPECATMAAFVGSLRDAAAAEGFTLVPAA